MKAMDFKNEAGNVLWLVMVAVVLIAVLSLVISRSGSSVESMAEREQGSVKALSFMRYARSLENAVQNMNLQGISVSDLSFENPLSGVDYENSNCDDTSCRVFHVEGGGMSYLKPKEAWLDGSYSGSNYYGDWLFIGGLCIPDVGRGDANCDAATRNADLIAVLPFVNESLCRRVNALMKIDVSAADPPVSSEATLWSGSAAHFTGTFASDAVLVDSAGDLSEQPTGCFGGSGSPPSGSYHFYHVIKAR